MAFYYQKLSRSVKKMVITLLGVKVIADIKVAPRSLEVEVLSVHDWEMVEPVVIKALQWCCYFQDPVIKFDCQQKFG